MLRVDITPQNAVQQGGPISSTLALARETRQPAGRIAGWQDEFLAAGREGLKSRPVPIKDRRLAEAQRKIGELTMDLNILRALNEEMDRRPQFPRR